MKNNHLTWLELDAKTFHNNLKAVLSLSGKREIAATVKANAYGHGLVEILGLLKNEPVSYIALHSVDETVLARKTGWTGNILIVGYIALNDLEAVFDLNLEPTVYNTDTINKLGKLTEKFNKLVNLHLKIETGTNRQGVEPAKIGRIVSCLKKYPHLILKGVSTHFANIEDTTDHSYANSQLKIFNKAFSDIKRLGLNQNSDILLARRRYCFLRIQNLNWSDPELLCMACGHQKRHTFPIALKAPKTACSARS